MTPKQEKFAACIADGMTQADAYRTAFDASRMKDSSIHVNASKLLSDAKVTQRVGELRSKLATKALWSREMSVQALVQAYKVAKDQASATGMTGAVKELNAMHGFNSAQKHEVTGAGGGPIKTLDVTKLSTDVLAAIVVAQKNAD